MRAYDLIQVLWVEDDPNVTDSYPQEAEIYGLELVSFPCWDDAKEALVRDFDRWSAIILDDHNTFSSMNNTGEYTPNTNASHIA